VNEPRGTPWHRIQVGDYTDVRALLDALRSVEYLPDGAGGGCTWCAYIRPEHAPSCKVGKALAPFRVEEA
jgi:hypothetical protein